jgi:hypothetical protein
MVRGWRLDMRSVEVVVLMVFVSSVVVSSESAI